MIVGVVGLITGSGGTPVYKFHMPSLMTKVFREPEAPMVESLWQ